MFATPKLLASLAAIVVGLVLLLVEALWVILGGHPLATVDEVLLWVGFGLVAAGAVALVWAIATETPADQPRAASWTPAAQAAAVTPPAAEQPADEVVPPQPQAEPEPDPASDG